MLLCCFFLQFLIDQRTIGLSPSNNAGSSLGSPANLFFSQFYQNLFALRPDLEFMFPDIQRQSAALSGIFSAALAMLDNIHALDDVLERLGRRHSYIMGVEPEHVCFPLCILLVLFVFSFAHVNFLAISLFVDYSRE